MADALPTTTSAAGCPAALDDGRAVRLRILGRDDALALATAVEGENRVDLYRRFLGTPPPIRTLVARLCAADDVHDLAVGAYDPEGELVAVAQFDRRDERPEAEIALEVAHGWQRVGLGRILLDRLADEARRQGVEVLTASFFADNRAIRKLLLRLGAVMDSAVVSGVASVRVDIRGRAPETVPDTPNSPRNPTE